MIVRVFSTVALASVVTLAPKLAFACAVCMSGRDDETRLAFEIATAFMTVTPLLMVGGVLLWLRRRFKELEARHEAARSGEGAVAADARRGEPILSLER